MNTSQPKPPRRTRKASFNAEALETRALLTGGAGNTFAIMQSSIVKADTPVNVPFVLSSNLVTKPHGTITIGIDVAAHANSTALPKIVGLIDNVTHRPIAISHAIYNPVVQRVNPQAGPQTAAITATIRSRPGDTAPHSYTVVVQGINHTAGNILVGFYLPGDANGDGVVDNTDIIAIKGATNSVPGDTKYLFPADANRNGRINATDLKLARENLGAKVTVSPVVSADLSPASDSGLQDRVTNIRNVTFTGVATPGAAISFDEASIKTPAVSTLADATGKYTIQIPLGDGVNSFRVTSTDGFGQSISGLIAPVTYSVHAPALIPSTTATAKA